MRTIPLQLLLLGALALVITGCATEKVALPSPSIAAVQGDAVVGLDLQGKVVRRVDAKGVDRLLYSEATQKLWAITGTKFAEVQLEQGILALAAELPAPYGEKLQHNTRNEARLTHDTKTLCAAFSAGDPVMPDPNGEIDYEEEPFALNLVTMELNKAGCPEPPGFPNVQNCRGKCMQWHCFCEAKRSKADGTQETTVCRRTQESCKQSESDTLKTFEGKMGLEISRPCERLTSPGAVNSYDHPADALGPKNYQRYEGWKPMSGQDAWFHQGGCFLPKDQSAKDSLRVVSSESQCGIMAKGKFLAIEKRPEIGDCWVTLGAISPSRRYVEVHANQGGGAAMVIQYAVRFLDLQTGTFVDFKGQEADGFYLDEDTTRFDVEEGLRRGWSPNRDLFIAGAALIDLEGEKPVIRSLGDHAVFLQ